MRNNANGLPQFNGAVYEGTIAVKALTHESPFGAGDLVRIGEQYHALRRIDIQTDNWAIQSRYRSNATEVRVTDIADSELVQPVDQAEDMDKLPVLSSNAPPDAELQARLDQLGILFHQIIE